MPTRKTTQALLTVDLQHLKPAVQTAAAAAGQPPSTWLRHLVATTLARHAEAPAVTEAQPNPDEPAPPNTAKTTFRLPAHINQELTRLAHHEGISRTRWIERRITDPHTQSLTPADVEAINQSTYHLSAIGRNLNQIARHLNAQPALMTRHERDTIAAALATLQAHILRMDTVMSQIGPLKRERRRHP